jgi:hypothetical protein
VRFAVVNVALVRFAAFRFAPLRFAPVRIVPERFVPLKFEWLRYAPVKLQPDQSAPGALKAPVLGKVGHVTALAGVKSAGINPKTRAIRAVEAAGSSCDLAKDLFNFHPCNSMSAMPCSNSRNLPCAEDC